MPDPIRVRSRSAGRRWPEAGRMILGTPASFRTGSVFGPKPDTISQNYLNRIRAGFAQYYPGDVCGRTEPSLKVGKLAAGRFASCHKPGQMIPAHRFASRPDAFGQTLTRPPRSDPGRFCANTIQVCCGQTGLKRFLEVGSGTVYDPARFDVMARVH